MIPELGPRELGAAGPEVISCKQKVRCKASDTGHAVRLPNYDVNEGSPPRSEVEERAAWLWLEGLTGI